MTGKRVLLLGAGAMGTVAAATVASFAEVESLLVADLGLAAAEKAASACGAKATATTINVTDRPALVSLMRDNDVVMNCVGPFFRFGVPVLEAAMEAGVDYLDICDDPEPTRAMHEMSGKAKAAGITAVVGLGASPGITSLLAARARQELDRTEELVAGWNIEEGYGQEDKLAYSAAIVHWMQQCSGLILECDRGRLVESKPLQDVSLDYPGRGTRTVYTVGHPEPVSFHYSYPDLPRSFCVMVMPGMAIREFRDLAQQIDSRKMTLEEAGKKLITDAGTSSFFQGILEGLFSLFDYPRLPRLFAVARGTKGGRPATVAASIRSIPSGMARATGIPLALGTLLHLRGKVPGPGVIAPEIAFETGEFFQLLSPYCTFPEPLPAAELVEVVEVSGEQ